MDLAPPPLPPKTRRSPPSAPSATVLDCLTSYPEDNHSPGHIVKIHINPDNKPSNNVICEVAPCIRVTVNKDMVRNDEAMVETPPQEPAFFFYNTFNCAVMSSGQVSLCWLINISFNKKQISRYRPVILSILGHAATWTAHRPPCPRKRTIHQECRSLWSSITRGRRV